MKTGLIFMAGGTGFIGRHLMRALKEGGRAVRCLARNEARAKRCKEKGFDSSIGDISERETIRGVLDGADMVVHLAGIIEEKGRQTFKRLHVEGTANLVDEAKRAGARHFFFQSALGASADSWAKYLKTKAEAEEIVKASGIPFTIFRPSFVIGPGDGFTSKIADVIKAPSPVIPVPGKGGARFQPIYVEDWVRCFLGILDNPGALGKTYEFGGPEFLTYDEMVKAVAEALRVGKPLLHIPRGIAAFGIKLLEKTPLRQATSEQLRLLEIDSVCDKDSVKTLFGFEPVAFADALTCFTSRLKQGR